MKGSSSSVPTIRNFDFQIIYIVVAQKAFKWPQFFAAVALYLEKKP